MSATGGDVRSDFDLPNNLSRNIYYLTGGISIPQNLHLSDLQLQPKSSLICSFYLKLLQFLQFLSLYPLWHHLKINHFLIKEDEKCFLVWFKDFEVIGSLKVLSDLSVKVFNIFAHSRFRRSQKTVKLVWWPFTFWKTSKIRWLCPGLTASYWQLGEFQTQTPLE